MRLSRREFVTASLGLFATGCAGNIPMVGVLPGPAWPAMPAPAEPQRRTPRPQAKVPVRPATPQVSAVHIIPRATWTRSSTSASSTVAMGRIDRITVHHEGWHPVHFTDARQTIRRLQQIRQIHTRDNHWADIGYHLVIDRAGRIWEGRPMCYQGAHVRDQNEHNLGIMCLGNFDRQSPTRAQLAGLQRTLTDFRHRLRIPAGNVLTHQEINPTRCPGAALQRHMLSLRNGRGLT